MNRFCRGATYSNDYTAELQKQGFKGGELRDRLNARDFEFPDEVALHYFLHSVDLNSGKINWKREFYLGRPPGGMVPPLELRSGALENAMRLGFP